MPLLIVDDSESSLLALETAVRGFAGCVVESFTNPLEALARCQAVDFDVVLVDYMMPEMDDPVKSQKQTGCPHRRARSLPHP
ncbi:response regulator, partial [Rhizobium johnstonii]